MEVIVPLASALAYTGSSPTYVYNTVWVSSPPPPMSWATCAATK